MDNKTTIEYFYTAFANGDAERMVNCYHEQIEFYDPAFGKLHGEKAKNMWRMLLSRNKNIDISFSDIQTSNNRHIAIEIIALHIIKELTAATDFCQKSTPAGIVF